MSHDIAEAVDRLLSAFSSGAETPEECDTERPRSAMSLREILTLNYEGQQNIYGICHEQFILFKGGAYLVKRWLRIVGGIAARHKTLSTPLKAKEL